MANACDDAPSSCTQKGSAAQTRSALHATGVDRGTKGGGADESKSHSRSGHHTSGKNPGLGVSPGSWLAPCGNRSHSRGRAIVKMPRGDDLHYIGALFHPWPDAPVH